LKKMGQAKLAQMGQFYVAVYTVYARYLGSAVRDAFFAQAKRAERVEARHLDNLDNPDTMRYDRDNDAPRDHAGAGGGRDEQG